MSGGFLRSAVSISHNLFDGKSMCVEICHKLSGSSHAHLRSTWYRLIGNVDTLGINVSSKMTYYIFITHSDMWEYIPVGCVYYENT